MNRNNHDKIFKWIDSIKKLSHFSVREIGFDAIKDWMYSDGKIHHSQNKFFNIVGVKFADHNGNISRHILIEQREIGTLGFICRYIHDSPELLIQAKIEPGNIGVVQIAPSCQATKSNADRIHGGESPPFSKEFSHNDLCVISDSLQSEHGSRFLGKLNRNVLATPKYNLHTDSIIHKWVAIGEVLDLLSVDYLINTDARSVLVCSNWEKLIKRTPFTRNNSTICKLLRESYCSNGYFEPLLNVKNRINEMRRLVPCPEIISLEDMSNYRLGNDGIFPKDKSSICVKFINVKTKLREVTEWSQPILKSTNQDRIDLVCARKNGVLHFLLKLTIEPGLVNKIELGVTSSIATDNNHELGINDEGIKDIVAQAWQSDEGGRFFQDKSLYRIVDAGDVFPIRNEYTWLSLGEICQLLQEGGWLTNELRSALSLLMRWL